MYPDFENTKLKKFFRKTCTGDPNRGGMNAEDSYFLQQVEQIAKEDGYKDGRWLVKCGAAHIWPFIKNGNPIVFVDRNLASVQKHNIAPSRIRACNVMRNHLRHLAALKFNQLETCYVYFVDYDELIEGEYKSLYRPFHYEKIPYNIPLIHGCINPAMCHYKKGENNEE